jgi:flagellar hook-length control protein FliK
MLPAAVAAAIVIPLAPPAATDPATTTTDGNAGPTILPAAPTGVSTEPAQAQSPQAALAADPKTGIPTEDATSTKAAPTAATVLAEPVLPGSPPTTEGRPDGQAAKTDKAKATQSGGTARTAAPAHPAPTPQSADTPADAQDKPAARAVHPRVPAADHAAATLPAPPTESRDIAPANAMPAQPNGTGFNPAASALTMPTLWPVTALRVDAAPGIAVPIAGLAVEIVSRAEAGLKRFDIRLDPPDLGRIDVRLDVDHNGRVTSRLIVERADTLDLLRRDAPSLERALQQAGLKTDGGIDFSLRDQSFRDQAPRDNAPLTRLIVPDDEPAATEAALRGYGRLIGLGGGVDIRV